MVILLTEIHFPLETTPIVFVPIQKPTEDGCVTNISGNKPLISSLFLNGKI